MINRGREWDWMEEEVQVEEILTEANAYNLKAEVNITAMKFMKEDPGLSKVAAYQMAYIEWVK